jgi:hypothetical protein
VTRAPTVLVEPAPAHDGAAAADGATRAASPARWVGEVGIGVMFVVAGVLATWPLAAHAGSRLPYNLIDPAENAWIFSWTAHALAHSPLQVFDANIFHPEELTLAYAESMLGLSVPLAPLYWITGNAVLLVNVAAIALYAVTGYGVYLLVREVGTSRGPALVAGLAFAVTPYRVFNIVHLHVVAVHLIPFALVMVLRMARDGPSRRRMITLTILVAAQLWSSLTGGILLMIVLGTWAAWELARHRRQAAPAVVRTAAAAVAGLILSLPVLIPYALVRREHPEFRHPPEEVIALSARPTSYLVPATSTPMFRGPWRSLGTRFQDPQFAWEKLLFPGLWLSVAGLTGGIVAGVVALRRRPRPAWCAPAGLFGAIGVVGFVLSLGPRYGAVPDGIALPYAALTRVVPGNLLRVPARLGVLVLLALAVLGGLVLSRAPRRLRRGAVVLSVAIVVLETVPAKMPTAQPPRLTAAHEAVGDAPGAVLLLPTVEARGDGTLTGASMIREPVQLYLSTAHFRPVTNGYAAFFPPSAVTLLRAVQDFPSPPALELLRRRDVRTVVVQTAMVARTPWADVVSRLEAWPGVRRIAIGPGVRVYDIHEAEASA